MAIRKRVWQTQKGVQTAWVLNYADLNGDRRQETFEKKADAQARDTEIKLQKGKGIHVPSRGSVTIKEAGKKWLDRADREGLERSTTDQYEQHLKWHINPLIGNVKLSDLNVPLVKHFRDERLPNEPVKDAQGNPVKDRDGHERKRSPAMIRAVMSSLGALLAEAQEAHQIGHNPVRELRAARRQRYKGARRDRHKAKLEVGKDIPSPAEIRTLIAKAEGRWKPFLMTAATTGLRLSELRGLRWDDVDLTKDKEEVHVRQRADRYGTMGSPKSFAGARTVRWSPMSPTHCASGSFNAQRKTASWVLSFRVSEAPFNPAQTFCGAA